MHTSAEAYAAAGCSKADLANWKRRSLISLPPAVTRSGRGRRYSLANTVEFGVLAETVGMAIGPAEGLAARYTVERFRAISEQLGERLHEPDALSGTEFDPDGATVWLFTRVSRQLQTVENSFLKRLDLARALQRNTHARAAFAVNVSSIATQVRDRLAGAAAADDGPIVTISFPG